MTYSTFEAPDGEGEEGIDSISNSESRGAEAVVRFIYARRPDKERSVGKKRIDAAFAMSAHVAELSGCCSCQLRSTRIDVRSGLNGIRACGAGTLRSLQSKSSRSRRTGRYRFAEC